MYISSDLVYTHAKDLEDNGVELLCVSLIPFKSNCPLYVVGIYRPEDNTELDGKIEDILDQLYITNKEEIILGDMNINAMDKIRFDKHRLIKHATNLGFQQLIYKVTQASSKSCLDPVYSNYPEHIEKWEVFDIGLSDHLPVGLVRK